MSLFIIFCVWALLTGLCLGSFYNVCIHRYITGESIVWPGSHCPKCGHKLALWENIPLVSYMILRGRCHDCAQPISRRYPLVEGISGLWALLLALKFGISWAFLVYMVFGGALIVMSFIDFELYILPDVINLPGGVLSILAAIFVLHVPWLESILGAAIGAGVFLALQQFYARVRGIDGLGTGDVKLMVMLGGMLGWKGLPLMILMSSVLALAGSVYYMRRQPGDGFKTMVPFGPFLSLGAMLYVLAGPEIVSWYLAFLRH